MNKVWLGFWLLAFLGLNTLSAKITWCTRYEEALQVSTRTKKPLLLFFHGSDWSDAAMRLKHEVLNSAIFEAQIEDLFVCVEIDFPKHKALAQEFLIQNMELKEKFHVQEPPCLIVIDNQQRVITRISYLPYEGMQLAEDLKSRVAQDLELVQALQEPQLSAESLRKFYQYAQELGQETVAEKILALGLETKEPYFFLENYRLLIEKDEMYSQCAMHIRSKLMELDPHNNNGTHFTLALLDFQELSCRPLTASEVVRPLINYVRQFGHTDASNIWRIEMMVAQFYLEKDQWQEALKHAEQAYQAAPEGMHREIAHSLEYIRATPH